MRIVVTACLILSLVASSPASALCEIRLLLDTYPEGFRLQKWNLSLAKSSVNVESLYRSGLVVDDDHPVFALRDGVPDPSQATGFRRVFLPEAKTGFYLPADVDLKNSGSIHGYAGIILILPGIGTDRSEASTLFTIGQTLNSGKDPALKVDESGRKIRLLPVLLDATLGGLGSSAPLYFGRPWESAEVIRHTRLIVGRAFPGVPCFLAGRSQGGLMAMEYANWFPDVAGVVAVNPSPTRREMHLEAMRLSTGNLQTVMSSPVKLNRTYRSYEIDTPDFIGFGAHGYLSRLHRWLIRGRHGYKNVPTLLLIGLRDESYPPEYLDEVKKFVAQDVGRRAVFVGGPHDLWTRRDKALYREVVGAMAQFFNHTLNP